MKLSNIDLKELHDLAVSAIEKAGEFIESVSVKHLKTYKKEAGSTLASSIVTEIDIDSQNIIINELNHSLKKFDLGILTEETVDNKSRFSKDFFWCIDPLDGTLPFVEGRNGFAVSVSLISKNGTPFIGTVYNPREKTTYSAIKGHGANKNHKKWIVPKPNKYPTLIMDRSFINNAKSIVLKSILKGTDSVEIETLSYAGAVMNAIWCIENSPALYFKLPKENIGGGSIWDFASTVCIFNELGLISTNAYGNKLNLNDPDSTFLNKQGTIFSTLAETINLSTHPELI